MLIAWTGARHTPNAHCLRQPRIDLRGVDSYDAQTKRYRSTSVLRSKSRLVEFQSCERGRVRIITPQFGRSMTDICLVMELVYQLDMGLGVEESLLDNCMINMWFKQL